MMELTFAGGVTLLFVYFIIVFLLARISSSGTKTKVGYLQANRSISEWRAAFSIASAWIWAPALFISAQKAYLEGLVGLFWFTVPNVMTLALFGHFGEVLRKKIPHGYSLTAYMRENYGKRTHQLYLFQNFGLLVSCLAVQMLGGGKVLAAISSIPYPLITLLLSLIAISYSLLYGLKASIITDWFKMALLLVLLALIVPWAVINSGGFSVVVSGLGGKTGAYTSLFSGKGAEVFWSFGLATTIGLLSGPFGDQSFYQRAFAIAGSRVKGAFYKGAILFAMVPLSLALLGFIMAGSNATVTDPSLVNFAAVKAFLPSWASILFVFLVVSALLSAMDSHFTAIGSLAGHDLATDRTSRGGDPDLTSREEDQKVLSWSRWGMVMTAVVAIGIANIPGMQVLYLFLFYGTLRASTLLPTVFTVLVGKKIPEWGVFYGVLASLTIGLPVFSYGNFTKNPLWIVVGSLATVLISGVTSLLALWMCGQTKEVVSEKAV